jgi:hypothetical protein
LQKYIQGEEEGELHGVDSLFFREILIHYRGYTRIAPGFLLQMPIIVQVDKIFLSIYGTPKEETMEETKIFIRGYDIKVDIIETVFEVSNWVPLR